MRLGCQNVLLASSQTFLEFRSQTSCMRDDLVRGPSGIGWLKLRCWISCKGHGPVSKSKCDCDGYELHWAAVSGFFYFSTLYHHQFRIALHVRFYMYQWCLVSSSSPSGASFVQLVQLATTSPPFVSHSTRQTFKARHGLAWPWMELVALFDQLNLNPMSERVSRFSHCHVRIHEVEGKCLFQFSVRWVCLLGGSTPLVFESER